MAGAGSAQQRLDTIVRIIAANMVAEVCSVYLLRAGEVLELFATEGLKPGAVHVTRMQVGEGLVGTIAASAQPLNLPDAQSHPAFAYRPETGEEIYQSLLGVPVLRGGKVIGVLVVQNRTRRRYTEEEVESLETVAMVLAELVIGSNLVDPREIARVDGNATLPLRIEGRALSEGLALGSAVLHEPRFEVKKAIAEDIGEEKRRLEAAVLALRASIDRLLAEPDPAIAGESRDVLEAYKMFAHDTGWFAKMHLAVESGLTAEAAVQKVQIETRHRMQQITDPYLRERLVDLEDLANRLYLQLLGKSAHVDRESMPPDAILFARALGPADLLDYHRAGLQGLVLEEGSPTAHVAIVARALQIPVIGRCEGAIAAVEPGDYVVVNGDDGVVYIRPGEDVLRAVRQNVQLRAERQAKYAQLRRQPAVTRCGERIALHINAGLTIDLPQLDETGADGIGLFRTELQFMVRPTLPRVGVQTDYYSRVLDVAGERPVIFRTLDIGGDKALPYLGSNDEENPAMGWRAIRIGLDRPSLLRAQLRALLLAAGGRRLMVMFPMIAEVAEYQKARELLELERQRLTGQGKAVPREVRIGTMLEVPSLAWQFPALLPLVDFISVGSNDLSQYFFAADRGNPLTADRYDLLSPALLSFLRWVARQCEDAGVPISVCGEMAGRPLEAMALIGLGFRNLSMAASAIGPVKEMVLSLDVPALVAYLNRLLVAPDHSLRGRLLNFAKDHGVVI
ncbi:MAG: phosphoenolpyruvate--protein phosphotransferase [Alphaproteobacteria bacterium]|nr:phosphoenolpyruvate--protein phosphotransferase [Alphaproteobacteria bacterium]